MIQKRFLSVMIVLLAFTELKAQLPDYKTRISLIKQAIDTKLRDNKTGLYFESTDSTKRENLHSWLWPLCAYIQAANEMEVLEPQKEYMLSVEQAIEQYYSDKAPAPAYQDYVTEERLSSRFYDDNQWIAIAYLDAYKRAHNTKHLDVAAMICRFMLTGKDTVTGGGMYWKEGDLSTKNTCSNGPGVLVLLQLYQITGKAEYLRSAIEVYRWTNKRLQAPDGLFYDNINTQTLNIAKAIYTYNTGTMLQANVLLYKILQDAKYLKEAQRIASAGRTYFYKNGRLPNGEYWFNAVMLRGYEELYKIDKNKTWIDFYQQDADAIWINERDANNMLGSKPAKRLIDQAAMIEIYARLEQLKNIN